MTWRYLDPEKEDNNFGILPQIRRVRRMSSGNRSDALLGSHFAVDDSERLRRKGRGLHLEVPQETRGPHAHTRRGPGADRQERPRGMGDDQQHQARDLRVPEGRLARGCMGADEPLLDQAAGLLSWRCIPRIATTTTANSTYGFSRDLTDVPTRSSTTGPVTTGRRISSPACPARVTTRACDSSPASSQQMIDDRTDRCSGCSEDCSPRNIWTLLCRVGSQLLHTGGVPEVVQVDT